MHDDAYHPLVFDREASHVLIGEHRNGASTQHLQEMADQAQPLATHVVLLALANEVLVPIRETVDAAPRDLLFSCHEAGNVVGYKHAFAPIAQIEPRNEVDLHG